LPTTLQSPKRERGALYISQELVWSQARTIALENTGTEREAEAMLGCACRLALEHVTAGDDERHHDRQRGAQRKPPSCRQGCPR
jgi:hypothetical protein